MAMDSSGGDPIFDVIIVGAGPGGLSCAKHLSGSGLRVLVLEKSPDLGKKICSGEISSKMFPGKDPTELFDGAQEWRTVVVGTRKGISSVEYDRPFLWTVGRYELENYLKSGCDGNTEIRFSEPVTAITQEYLETTKGRYRYRRLVGADGSFSKVREYLKLPSEHVVGYAFHYVLDRPAKEFRVYWLPHIFPRGYGYVMSKGRGATMVGGAMAGKDVLHKDLAPRVRNWVRKEFSFDVSKAKSEAFKGNADYRGWRFGNVFLVGDAAGLLNPVTTEGIYYAVTSGKAVARHIRGDGESERIMGKLEATHRAQVFLFDIFTDPKLPFRWFVNWVLSDPRKGIRRKIFDLVFWRFMDH